MLKSNREDNTNLLVERTGFMYLCLYLSLSYQDRKLQECGDLNRSDYTDPLWNGQPLLLPLPFYFRIDPLEGWTIYLLIFEFQLKFLYVFVALADQTFALL